jgi:thiol-disulfide isomerase/thioredoxin
MRRALSLLISTLVCPLWLLAQSATIELPIQFISGYGQFVPGFGGVSMERSAADNPWFATYLPVKGIPATWTDSKKGMIWLDAHQFVYQNVMTGKIKSAWYKELQSSWSWTPDSTRLSAKPIRCFVYVATGLNKAGNQAVIVDTNHNLDFSDEQVIEPPTIDSIWAGKAGTQHFVTLPMDYYGRSQVLSRQVTIAIGLSGKNISCNYPGYASASLTPIGSRGTLLLAPDRFTNTLFDPAVIALADTAKPGRKLYDGDVAREGEYLTIGTDVFVNQGVDLSRNVLRLGRAGNKDSLYSSQQGYRAYPFNRMISTAGKSISLGDYKGKYVLLDFWGTWCAPCRAETPFLREAYTKTSRDDIEFISIASDDTPEKVKAYCLKEQLNWPQLVSDEVNKLAATYHVNSWPTTILIDPDGKVLSKGLRGKSMVDVLTKLPPRKP